MPYPKGLEGKYIDYRVDPGGTQRGKLPDKPKDDEEVTTLATVPIYRCVIAKILGEPEKPDQFVNTNTVWTFTFLRYFAGAVTVTNAPVQSGIMTGPMTGCYLFTYTQVHPKLAHIGTGSTPTCPESLKVKEVWGTLVKGLNKTELELVKGVDPASSFTYSELAKAMIGGRPPEVVAYFDNGQAFAMLLAPLPREMAPPNLSLRKVVKVKKLTLEPWAAIATTPKFSALPA